MSRTRSCLSDSFDQVEHHSYIFRREYSSVFRLTQPTYDLFDDIDISFLSLRVGTKFGIVTHALRVDSRIDSDYWMNAMTQTIRTAVIQSTEVVFRKSHISC